MIYVDTSASNAVAGYRLHDFMIKVLNHTENPSPTDLPNSYTHTGSIGNGEWFMAQCTHPAAGKGVVIMIPGKSETLSLCEVEVYSGISMICICREQFIMAIN